MTLIVVVSVGHAQLLEFLLFQLAVLKVEPLVKVAQVDKQLGAVDALIAQLEVAIFFFEAQATEHGLAVDVVAIVVVVAVAVVAVAAVDDGQLVERLVQVVQTCVEQQTLIEVALDGLAYLAVLDVHALVELVEIAQLLRAEETRLERQSVGAAQQADAATAAHAVLVLALVRFLLDLAALDVQPLVEVVLEVLEGLEAVGAVLAQNHVVLQLAVEAQVEIGAVVAVAAVVIVIILGLCVGVVVVVGVASIEWAILLGLDELSYFARFDVHFAVKVVEAEQVLGAVDATLFGVQHCFFCLLVCLYSFVALLVVVIAFFFVCIYI